MIKEIEGIVISELDYKESSKIIKIITEEGIISIIAKGARKLKSDIRNTTTKLTYGIFHMYYKEDGLSTLISVDIKDNFKNIKKDIKTVSYTSYLIELSTQVMKQNNNPSVYKLLVDSLKKINEMFDYEIITNILELKYLDYLGVMPIIDECSICGSKNSIATISGRDGGYICNNCLTNQPLVDEKTIKLIRMFYYVDISKISNLDISNKSILEISNFLDDYYDRYTGLYLKSKKLLKNINKVS